MFFLWVHDVVSLPCFNPGYSAGPSTDTTAMKKCKALSLTCGCESFFPDIPWHRKLRAGKPTLERDSNDYDHQERRVTKQLTSSTNELVPIKTMLINTREGNQVAFEIFHLSSSKMLRYTLPSHDDECSMLAYI